MEFLKNLLFTPSVPQSLLVLAITIAIGLYLGAKLKIKNMSLGVTWILFCGILFSAFGLQLDPQIEHFVKDFGLILFVYSIGLQVGPSFFSSLGKGGLKLNLLAMSIVLGAAVCAIAIHFITGEDMSTLVGVMSGAVTNTPSLGAAQQTYSDVHGVVNSNIANGYAVAYPLGVVGIIVSIMLIRLFFRINMKDEEQKLLALDDPHSKEPIRINVRLTNEKVYGITIDKLHEICQVKMVVSRIIHPDQSESVATSESVINRGDTLRILTDKVMLDTIGLLGEITILEKKAVDSNSQLISRRIVVTKPEWNGQRIGKVTLEAHYNITTTRVNRAGIDLLATPNLRLQLGDRIMVVGEKDDVQRVADLFGNELKRLDVPNLIPIFFGIALGILVGTAPIMLPGLSQPFKFGLAGGSLIVALLVGRFGPSYKMVTFSTTSANMMLREVGLALFLAAVGLSAGGDFIPAILAGGYWWILYGVIITMIPILLIGCIAYKAAHVNYFTLMGLIAGSTTDPPALAYASAQSVNNDQASVAYATVYPLTMFLRVLVAQFIILLMC